MMGDTQVGWSVVETSSPPIENDGIRNIEIAFARCFGGEDGHRVLAHLKSITLERASGPAANDAALRHLDGQRCLVLHIQSLIERGRSPL